MFSSDSHLNLLVTGGAGFIGSNLVLALQERFARARLTVIDDFRSGDFKNLEGYRGDFVAQDLAKLNWSEQFGDERFDAIFHLASITDTTLHDQFVQVHDNVESFRGLLRFAQPNEDTRDLCVVRVDLWRDSEASTEANGAAPANVYAFSKVMMDNLARRADGRTQRLGHHRSALFQRLRTTRGAQRSAGKHDLSSVETDEGGTAPPHLQAWRTEARFRLREGCCGREYPRTQATRSGIYNLGCGQARSFNELVDILNRSLGTNFDAEYIDNPHAHYQNFTQAELTNARTALGYEPQYPLERGVADYMAWLYPQRASSLSEAKDLTKKRPTLKSGKSHGRSRGSSLRSE